MADFDLISIGDSTIDVFMDIDPSDTEALCKLDDNECLISFKYGAKIPVKSFTRIAAVGNAANNAIGSSRLGLKTAIYTMLGSDNEGREMKKIFEDEDVETKFIVTESEKRSNFSVVLNYSAERSIFVYHEERNYNLPELGETKWVYFTSIGKGHEALHQQIPDYIKKSGARLGYNPGTYELKEGVEILKPVLETAEVLLVNREEAHGLVGKDLQDIKGLLADLKANGPQIVVITDGRDGSYASIDGREVWFCPVPLESPVVERTGCGDAYSTGFLAALVQGKELPEAMLWGTMNATSVIQYIGAREGLLTPEGMQKTIEKWGEFAKAIMI